MSDGISAFDNGADIIGVVRATNSPRYAADDVIRSLSRMNVRLAGVYTRLKDIGSEAAYLDYVQLHFRHDAETIRSIKEKHHVKVISVAMSTDPELKERLISYMAGGADILLVEFASGYSAEKERAKSLRQEIRFGIAGFIQYTDLSGIKKLDFSMIDVSRSLEASPGVKDTDRMSRFIREALN